jgi:hypothetical protein
MNGSITSWKFLTKIITYIPATRKPRRTAKSEGYFDFDDLFFDARAVVWLHNVRVVFYILFCRYTDLSIQKLRSPCPIRGYPERVFPEALNMLSLVEFELKPCQFLYS